MEAGCGRLLRQLLQRQGEFVGVLLPMAILDKMDETALEEIAEPSARLLGFLEPAFLENPVLGKLDDEPLRLIAKPGKLRPQENHERALVTADEIVQWFGMHPDRLGCVPESRPIGHRP